MPPPWGPPPQAGWPPGVVPYGWPPPAGYPQGWVPQPMPLPPPRPAGFGRRLLALLIDGGVAFIVLIVVSIAISGVIRSTNLGAVERGEGGIGAALAIALLQAVIYFGIPAYMAIGWHRGGTLGMRALHLRVLTAEGHRLGAGRALLRTLGAVLVLLPALLALPTGNNGLVVLAAAALGLVDILWASVDSRHRALHDLVAGTVVVHHPHGIVPPAPAAEAEPRPERSRWTWTDVIPVIVVGVPLTIGAQWAIVQVLTHLGAFMALDHDVRRAIGVTAESIAAYGADILLVLAAVKLRRHAPLAEMGFRLPSWRWALVALPAVAFAFVASSVLGIISVNLFPNTPSTQCQDIQQEFGGFIVVGLINVALIAPVAEEIIFRGFVLRWLNGRMAPGYALLVSAAIFSAAHAGYLQATIFLPVFGAGLILGAIYHYSRSLVPGMIVHGVFNGVVTLLLLLQGHC